MFLLSVQRTLSDLDEALKRLAAVDSRMSRVVELRYFGGLSVGGDRAGLGSFRRYGDDATGWARAWLYREIANALGTLIMSSQPRIWAEIAHVRRGVMDAGQRRRFSMKSACARRFTTAREIESLIASSYDRAGEFLRSAPPARLRGWSVGCRTGAIS